jgi:hypothetical protein
MTSYHFDVGNSNTGPIGMCARITAETKEDAIEILRDVLPDEFEIPCDHGAIEYIQVYLNADNVTEKDVDDEEDEE